MKNPHMGLRGGGGEVQLVVENGQTRPVIGTSEPQDEEAAAVQARVRVAQHWGGRPSPRQQAQGGITEPLSLRSRTILARQLPLAEQGMLDVGLPGDARVPESGVVTTVRKTANRL